MRMNDAFIFSQFWIIIVTRSTNDHDQKGLAMLPEISFLSVSQRTSSTSLPFDNLTQHSYQRYDESHLLEERNRRFQHYQRRKEAETSVDKQSDDMEDTIAEPLIRSPAVTFVKSYASNDTRLIPPANSSTLQNVAFLVLPNSDDQRNRRRTLSNNTGAPEEDTDDYKINEEDNGLNNNAIDMELEIRRKMERTTVEVRNYPPVTEASPPSVTANILSTDPEHNLGLSILATPIPLPFTPDFPNLHDIDFGTRTTVSYASLSTLPSHIVQDQHHIREVIQQPNVTELSAIPSSISASAPLALPIPLGKDEISFNHFDTQSGISALISDGHFRNSVSTDATTTNSVFEQRQLPEKIQMQTQISAREYEPVDDILGCTWDIVTNSCKDLFSLKLCSHCHDFGNIFLHNCKCLVKYTTAF